MCTSKANQRCLRLVHGISLLSKSEDQFCDNAVVGKPDGSKRSNKIVVKTKSRLRYSHPECRSFSSVKICAWSNENREMVI